MTSQDDTLDVLLEETFGDLVGGEEQGFQGEERGVGRVGVEELRGVYVFLTFSAGRVQNAD